MSLPFICVNTILAIITGTISLEKFDERSNFCSCIITQTIEMNTCFQSTDL